MRSSVCYWQQKPPERTHWSSRCDPSSQDPRFNIGFSTDIGFSWEDQSTRLYNIARQLELCSCEPQICETGSSVGAIMFVVATQSLVLTLNPHRCFGNSDVMQALRRNRQSRNCYSLGGRDIACACLHESSILTGMIARPIDRFVRGISVLKIATLGLGSCLQFSTSDTLPGESETDTRL